MTIGKLLSTFYSKLLQANNPRHVLFITEPLKELNFIFAFQTCLLWQTTVGNQDCHDSANSAKGSCRLYDNVPMSHYVMAIILVSGLDCFKVFSLS